VPRARGGRWTAQGGGRFKGGRHPAATDVNGTNGGTTFGSWTRIRLYYAIAYAKSQSHCCNIDVWSMSIQIMFILKILRRREVLNFNIANIILYKSIGSVRDTSSDLRHLFYFDSLQNT
jgi:hypothetical protein